MPFESTFMFNGKRVSSSVSLNSGFHEHVGIDAAALGLQHEPHIFGELIAHVVEQRQLLGDEQFGDLFDQPLISAPDREFR